MLEEFSKLFKVRTIDSGNGNKTTIVDNIGWNCALPSSAFRITIEAKKGKQTSVRFQRSHCRAWINWEEIPRWSRQDQEEEELRLAVKAGAPSKRASRL